MVLAMMAVPVFALHPAPLQVLKALICGTWAKLGKQECVNVLISLLSAVAPAAVREKFRP